ncbi:MAG: glycosyltransferase family 2 protein [Deltaproteobacteria bacterium]|nr:glycosyltransferase family 2 protein [Deltaproteobacteria bacterium]
MPTMVSFVIPVRNAVDTIEEAVERVLHADLGHADLHREIIVVDDASADGTAERLQHLAARGLARVGFHPEAIGQGAALSTALAMVSGDIVVVADATLAYDPSETGRLLEPIASGAADVVYGSRYVAASRQVPALWDRLADQLLTVVSNGLTNVSLTDVTTTARAFRVDVVRGAVLRADGCAIAGELAALFTTRQCRIFEVPVSYRTERRTPRNGRWLQGLAQLTMMARCRLRSWHLEAVAPHRPLPAAMPVAARGARLTRLVRPVDLMPMSPATTRPMLRAN